MVVGIERERNGSVIGDGSSLCSLLNSKAPPRTPSWRTASPSLPPQVRSLSPTDIHVPTVGCHSLLQGIFLTQGWKLHLLHWQADSSVRHLGSAKATQIFKKEEKEEDDQVTNKRSQDTSLVDWAGNYK